MPFHIINRDLVTRSFDAVVTSLKFKTTFLLVITVFSSMTTKSSFGVLTLQLPLYRLVLEAMLAYTDWFAFNLMQDIVLRLLNFKPCWHLIVCSLHFNLQSLLCMVFYQIKLVLRLKALWLEKFNRIFTMLQ